MYSNLWAILIAVAAASNVSIAQDAPKKSADAPSKKAQNAQSMQLPPTLADKVIFERDVVYGDAGHRPLKLDILRPKKPKSKKIPAVAFVHGGGWAGGDKAYGVIPMAMLAMDGEYLGVTISYRFSQEAKWPAQIHDCKAAIRWLRANAEKYGIDPDKIGCWGGSAGGHLVAMLATTADCKELEGDCGSKECSSRVSCAVNYFGPADLTRYGVKSKYPEGGKASQLLEALLGGPVDDKPKEAASASPINFVTKDDAPILFVHGDQDGLVPLSHSEILKAECDKNNVPAKLIVVKGGGHGFRNPEVFKRVKAYFDQQLYGAKVEVSSEPIQEIAPPANRKAKSN